MALALCLTLLKLIFVRGIIISNYIFNVRRKGNDIDPSHCEVNEWSEWTPCRAKCGTAKISRFRTYKYPEARKKCSALPGAFSLQETSDCYSREECTGSQEEEVGAYGSIKPFQFVQM